ncbi:13311_t:CDS:2 [Racocetra fulgida]|uniref:13311_t:CDS:1 n=1 Tax=Racocetra fulgida TaxID=60492 RepID=A0A9N9F203_9GLOM|nr:13311_t:CDS:2 [Racocetra fulgida]
MFCGHWTEHLIQKHSEWFTENLISILRCTWLIPTCNKIKQHCFEKICDDPWLLFASDQFYNVEEDILVTVLEREDLNLPEVYIWNNVIKWAKGQLSVGLDPDVSRWSPTDFSLLEEKMRNCLPRIRMNNIDMEEYYHNGKLVTREKNPFNFRLLIRGSDHGFCGEVFDRIRFEYPALLVLILTESEEMIGGYQRINSNYWKMFGYDYDRDIELYNPTMLCTIITDGDHVSEMVIYG